MAELAVGIDSETGICSSLSNNLRNLALAIWRNMAAGMGSGRE